jgi:hypothetical protein
LISPTLPAQNCVCDKHYCRNKKRYVQQRSWNISAENIRASIAALAAPRAEIAKCVVRCANFHTLKMCLNAAGFVALRRMAGTTLTLTRTTT